MFKNHFKGYLLMKSVLETTKTTKDCYVVSSHKLTFDETVRSWL